MNPSPARRIVSLVPSVTECLFDLGVGDRVVGRTDYCVSPPEALAVPTVGGPKTVDPGRVDHLDPDLVLANREENDRSQVEALSRPGRRVHVAFPRTVAEVAAFLEELGPLVGRTLEARAEAERLRRALGQVPEPAVPVVCLVWKNPYLTVTGDTLTSSLVEAAGGANRFADRTGRYPPVTASEIAAVRPRVVLLPTDPYPFTAADAGELEAAVPGCRVVVVQGEWLTWYGCRVPEALAGLRRVLAPFRGPGV